MAGKGYNKRSEATQFKKGQSGNPKGSLPGRMTVASVVSLTDLLRGISLDDKQGIVRKLVRMCLAGNVNALRLVFERMDGKVPDVVAIQGNIEHKVIPDPEALRAAFYAAIAWAGQRGLIEGGNDAQGAVAIIDVGEGRGDNAKEEK